MATGDGLKINKIITDSKLAIDAANYAESVKCETEVIKDENHILIWTTQYDGEFPVEK